MENAQKEEVISLTTKEKQKEEEKEYDQNYMRDCCEQLTDA